MTYKIWDEHGIRVGTAEQILYQITKKQNGLDSEIGRMSVGEYADALIDNAPYFLPEAVMNDLMQRSYESKYDQALTLLSYMPASSTRILSAEAENLTTTGA